MPWFFVKARDGRQPVDGALKYGLEHPHPCVQDPSQCGLQLVGGSLDERWAGPSFSLCHRLCSC